MASESKQTKQAAKSLHRLQAEQLQRTRQIGRLRGKLEKRSRQLQTLEVKMAKLERRAYGPGPDGHPVAAGPRALRPARLFINPTSGSFARLAETPEKLVARLRTHGIQAEVYLKTSSKTVRQWVREAVKGHEALVIVAGGDGTIEDVAAELVGSDTVLGIVPTGTMNNLARELGIPLDLEPACALLGAGITRAIDVGCVRSEGETAGHYFLETAGLGLAIAWPVGQNMKKGRWGKIPAALRKMLKQNTPAADTEPIVIELETGEKLETRVRLVTISNAPLYGLNNLVAPEAKMDDGLLDLAVYDGLSDLDLAAYFLATANGARVSNPNVRFYRTRRVQIRSRQTMPATSDKDELPGQQVLDYELIPRAVRMIVGRGSGLTWPVEAVTSVPPLSGAQAQAKLEPGEPAQPANEIAHAPLAELPPRPDPSLAGTQ